MSTRATVVVLGILGRTPFAGVAWQVLHYLEGLRRLGHDVYYVEDTGAWPYDGDRDTVSGDCGYTVAYIAGLMERYGLSDRWAYRCAPESGRVHGLSPSGLRALLGRADALLNLTGATVLREEHLRVPVRIYVETDPVVPQIQVAQGVRFTIDLLSAHTHHFTFGENLGTRDCQVPVERFTYRPTRQPIVLDWWGADGDGAPAGPTFTTVASWRQTDRDIQWNGETYRWSKHFEFEKFIDLPHRARQPLELALAADADTFRYLRGHGWSVVDALSLTRRAETYRDYVIRSAGEFTVAKDQNVRLRSGWFSDRSASYLAAGRPVVTQDTGFGRVLPTGRGLFAFRSMDEILAALDEIRADYGAHRRAAREIAREHFHAERVLSALLEPAGL